MWILYSLVIWSISVFFLLHHLNTMEAITTSTLYAGLPVVLIPFGIYYLRQFFVWFYDQKQKKEEANLDTLRKEQKEKVEELKKKTSYYSTQSLLERYDEVLAKKKEAEAKAKIQQEAQRKPMSMPVNRGRPMQPPQGPPGVNNNQFPPDNQQRLQPILPPTKTQPGWFDRLMDSVVGEVGPETKYALICSHCYFHNGLALQDEIDTIQYVCPNCKQFNPSRKSRRLQLNSQTPDEHLLNNVLNTGEGSLKGIVEKDEEPVKLLEEIRAEAAAEIEQNSTIGSRVRQRHVKLEDGSDAEN
ncbi:hypothetical protein BDB01DRAFT_712992 [Pilobolus umbonatus]|nr:hypothetical protein BDB01DRAFT_712992 [Pilobolus umbonatus]